MGYGSIAYFQTIKSLGGRRICELGDQIIQIDGKPVYTRKLWEQAGWEYVCVDVNQEGGAKFVDLNKWPNESAALGTFDIVTNMGTTEHVANQLAAFATIHHLLRPGGFAVHEVPVLNYMNHALVTVSPRFFSFLAAANGYKVIRSEIRAFPIHANLPMHYGRQLVEFDGIADTVDGSGAVIFTILQKLADAEFRPPLDVADDVLVSMGMRSRAKASKLAVGMNLLGAVGRLFGKELARKFRKA